MTSRAALRLAPGVSTPGPFLRVSDVAAMLGLSASRVYGLIKAKQVPAVKVGGCFRIPADAWARWVELQTEQALSSLKNGGAS